MADSNIVAWQAHDPALWNALKDTLYPGAQDAEVVMVLEYCQAKKFDPMLKPVHLVPMYVKSGQRDSKGKDIMVTRPVVMPGINMYRVIAARTGDYVGKDDPKFGPARTLKYTKKTTTWEGYGENRKGTDSFSEAELEYPEWCTVTVYRLVQGQRYPFSATERWLENYATAARGVDTPNEMWAKRAYGQLAKVAEAQALRMGFPEVGADLTVEEMEGRAAMHDINTPPQQTPEQLARKAELLAEAKETAERGWQPLAAMAKRLGPDDRALIANEWGAFKDRAAEVTRAAQAAKKEDVIDNGDAGAPLKDRPPVDDDEEYRRAFGDPT